MIGFYIKVEPNYGIIYVQREAKLKILQKHKFD